MNVWAARTIWAAFAALALLIFAGSLKIGASVWEALLITSSLMLAAVMTVVGGSVLLLRAGCWLRERLEERDGATRSSSETIIERPMAPTEDDG
jgi:hypothetical protein